MSSLIFRLFVKLTLDSLPLNVSEGLPLIILSEKFIRFVILSIMAANFSLFIIITLTDVASLLGLVLDKATHNPFFLFLLIPFSLATLLQALAPANL